MNWVPDLCSSAIDFARKTYPNVVKNYDEDTDKDAEDDELKPLEKK